LSDKRAYHLTRFYELLARLERNLGGTRRLSECSGRMDWPRRGVYFFRETGESRYGTGVGQRIVRVGTHALKLGARSTLWGRLSQHRGKADGSGGNHRGSVFRKIIGAALIERNGYSYPTWGHGNSAPKEVRERERPLEQEVSATLGRMTVLWLAVEDEPGTDSQRGYIERNAIALLSNYEREPIDPPSPGWLGHHSDREKGRQSSLWNSNHVEDTYTPAFLDTMEWLIEQMRVAGNG
jgi:hypothetical protein